MGEQKLFLLDGMALIFRAFFAFANNPRITSKGMNTSAAFGFTMALVDLIEREKPTHLAVAFDTSEPTHRHLRYPEYKAHRDEMPEDLASNLPLIERILSVMQIPLLKMPGYEADDIIGTLSGQAEKEGFRVYMVTSDKDFAQLVTERVFLYKPARMGNGIEVMGVPEVCARWEIKRPEQIIDILGLWGDSVDNIPGVPGVGEKTAKALIGQYGSIEEVIAHSSELKGKLQERIREHSQQALLSKELATIDRQVPVGVGIDELKRVVPQLSAIEEVFHELEFRTLWKRVQNLGNGTSVPITADPAEHVVDSREVGPNGYQMELFGHGGGGADLNRPRGSAQVDSPSVLSIHPTSAGRPFRTMADTQAHYQLVNDEPSRQVLLDRLLQEKVIAFDTEATGLDPLTAELVGMSFSFGAGTGFYVDCGSVHTQIQQVVDQFRPVFGRKDLLLVGQNLKFDLHIMHRYGVEFHGTLWDTMLAHYLMDPESRHNMEHMSEVYLHYRPQPISELIGKKGSGQRSMRDVDPGVVAQYASEDADVTLQLHQKFRPMLQEKGVDKLFAEIEMPLLPVLASMEWEGARVDPAVLQELSAELAQQISEKEQEVFEFAGMKFNLASPRQLGDVLFGSLRLDPKAKKTPGGQYKTDEEVLLGLASRHPVVRAVLDFRQAQKLRSTYTEALVNLIHPQTGRVHTTYNQAVAATGRLSSNQPNLQNIPIRTEKGREIRKAFVARDADHCLLSADYSQIELRIMASVSGDPHMMQAFADGLDIHAATAGRVYGIDPTAVDEHLRRKAKTVNFGIIYGISAFGLSQRLGIPRQEAADLISQYFTAYPGIRAYMHETIASARSRGYVETLMGRRRYIRDIQSANANLRGFAERNAINAPIQGSAADMIKMAMIRIHHEMKRARYRSRMILQVHDELVLDVYKPELEDVRSLVCQEMIDALPLNVPVVVDAGVGENWLEAH